jgi:hypothetical protein
MATSGWSRRAPSGEEGARSAFWVGRMQVRLDPGLRPGGICPPPSPATPGLIRCRPSRADACESTRSISCGVWSWSSWRSTTSVTSSPVPGSIRPISRRPVSRSSSPAGSLTSAHRSSSFSEVSAPGLRSGAAPPGLSRAAPRLGVWTGCGLPDLGRCGVGTVPALPLVRRAQGAPARGVAELSLTNCFHLFDGGHRHDSSLAHFHSTVRDLHHGTAFPRSVRGRGIEVRRHLEAGSLRRR